MPLFAERAFLLRVGAFTVGGRIDAIYGEPDGPWEIVDWKTGMGTADPLQLELYGLACVEIWGKRPEDLTLSYCYLAKDEIVSQPMADPSDVRARVEASLDGDRRRRLRADARSMVRALRFPELLRRGQRLARRERLSRTSVACLRVEPFDLLLERAVAPRPGRSRR